MKKLQAAKLAPVATRVSYPMVWDRMALWIGVGLVGLIAFTFGQTLSFGSISLDDSLYGGLNPYVRQGLTWEGLRFAFTAKPNYWQPFAFLAHMIDFQIFGSRLWGHHLMSVVLHSVNSVLLFFVLRALTSAVWPSAWVAAVFAVHPIHVEPVAWIASRRDLLSCLFLLLTVVGYIRYREAPSWKRYQLIGAGMFLAAATKPVTVVLPVLLLVIDFWPMQRRDYLNAFVEKLPLVLLAALFSLSALSSYQAGRAVVDGANASMARALPRAYTPTLYGFYLSKFFWPHPLSFEYTMWGDPLREVYRFLAYGTAAAAAACWLWFRKLAPWVYAGLVWWVVCFLPTLGMGNQDRFYYLPLIGIAIAVGWSAYALPGHLRTGAAVLGAVSVAGFAFASWQYSGYFFDSVPLYKHAIEATNGRSNTARMWLGSVYLERERVAEARQQFQAIASQSPGHFAAHLQLARCMLLMGEGPAALAKMESAVEIRAGDPNAHLLAAQYLSQMGFVREASTHYREALKLDPENATAQAGLESLKAGVGGG